MSQQWQERYAGAVMNTFGPPKLVLARGEGAHVWDADGKRVRRPARRHRRQRPRPRPPGPRRGRHRAADDARPRLQLLHQRPAGRAGRAAAVAGRPPTGGSSSPTPAPRPTRRRSSSPGAPAAPTWSPPRASFHGRTMGSLALTSKEAYRAPFEPLPGDVTFVPYGDEAALARAVTDQTAAVVLEPIQGEAGVVVPPADYLAAAREITRDNGALLWLDEVQTGIGRTGEWFAGNVADADVVTVAKGLGGGIPIGACIGLGDAATLLQPGNHGTTFGGNPVACAAALAVLDTIEKDGLLEHATAHGRAPPRRPGRRRRGSPRSAAAACSSASTCRGRCRPRSPPPRSRTASSSTTRLPTVSASLRPWSSATMTSTRSWPPGRGSSTTPTEAHVTRRDPLLPRRRRPQPRRAGRGAGPGRRAEAGAVRREAARRAAHRRHDLRQADPAHPGVLRRRHRRAGRAPDARRRRARRHRQARVGGRRGAGARPAGGRDRVADLRAGRDRGDGGVLRGAGRQRAHRRVPPLPAARRPADRQGAQGHPRRADRRVRRRRRLQHGQLLAARRRHRRACTCGSARPRARTPEQAMVDRANAIGAHDRRLARCSSATRSRPSTAPTSWSPTPGSRWARRARPRSGC